MLFRYGLAVLLNHKARLLAIDDLLEIHTYFRHDLQQAMDPGHLTKVGWTPASTCHDLAVLTLLLGLGGAAGL